VEKKQKKNLTWSVERCSWTFEVRMRTIQNLRYWRFSTKEINKKTKQTIIQMQINTMKKYVELIYRTSFKHLRW